MSQLTVKGLTLAYDGESVVKNISFSLSKGDYLCVVGENGTGKTTLLKSILGLIKPLSGQILFEDKAVRKGIGYLPQQTQIQRDFPASVREVVMSGFAVKSILPFFSRMQKQLAKEKMQLLGIANLSDKCYRELSGGQQQRVLLARALCTATSMLLLDEPTTGLDPKAAFEMYEILNKLNKEGLTVVMISHDIKMAVQNATHILHMNHGSEYFGIAEEYKNSGLGAIFFEDGTK